MPDIISGLPNIFNKVPAAKTKETSAKKQTFLTSKTNINDIQSTFGIALHMHQPTIPAGGNDLSSAALISNLQHMMDNQGIGDNHNAPVFLWCYKRMAEFIKELSGQGHNPRVMLDYSGNLLWGLRQMDGGKALDELASVTNSSKYSKYIEWVGTMWSHAVVSSTPIPDIRLHIEAWRSHFGSIFGDSALAAVKGFSPPEMHLPIHPDVCYEYIKTLKECGYEWLMVQEHTIENPDGSGIRRPHFPHKLVARNSLGKTEEITIIIKTQGSDTKLVAQMQPYYEAKSRSRENYAGKDIPPYVFQISDGENGGVMMNEFPPVYKQAFNEIGTTGVISVNGSEYLDMIKRAGVNEKDFIPVQPIMQHRLWEFLKEPGPGAADRAIDSAKAKYHDFNLEKASWTSDRNWVKGYESILDPINKLSAQFHEKFDGNDKLQEKPSYKKALLYLLLSQTSCFRYWGTGIWTDYAKELCRRGFEEIKKAK